MSKFYFTYGTAESFPYKGGWTEVIADDIRQAQALFRAVHPDRTPGIMNCAFFYTEEMFSKTDMFKNNDNRGYSCREIIGRGSAVGGLLDTFDTVFRISDDECATTALAWSLGAITFAQMAGLISEEEATDRKAKVILEVIEKEDSSEERCCFCGVELPTLESRNNAIPVKDGICCSKCNTSVVIPARIALAKGGS